MDQEFFVNISLLKFKGLTVDTGGNSWRVIVSDLRDLADEIERVGKTLEKKDESAKNN